MMSTIKWAVVETNNFDCINKRQKSLFELQARSVFGCLKNNHHDNINARHFCNVLSLSRHRLMLWNREILLVNGTYHHLCLSSLSNWKARTLELVMRHATQLDTHSISIYFYDYKIFVYTLQRLMWKRM